MNFNVTKILQGRGDIFPIINLDTKWRLKVIKACSLYSWRKEPRYPLKVWWAPDLVRGFGERKTLSPAGHQNKIVLGHSLVTAANKLPPLFIKYHCGD